MPLTNEQAAALDARGNVLVMAGAGTGKTTTLVGRCLRYVLKTEPRVSLDRLLLVTFTEAAAGEMRQRLREELERRAAASPDDAWLAEQLALIETARISTLHSFCYQLVREHFHDLGLDPQVNVLTEQEARLLEQETLDALLDQHYATDSPESQAVQQLVLDQGRGLDGLIRALVLRLHHYTQTLANPAAWLDRELAAFEAERPAHWERWLGDGFGEWRQRWIMQLRDQPDENVNAQACAEILERLEENPTRAQMAEVLAAILEQNNTWPKGKKGVFRKPIEDLFEDAAFLKTLAEMPSVTDRAPMGKGTSLPLTPALSLGERGKGTQPKAEAECQTSSSAECHSPSPWGESRGKGHGISQMSDASTVTPTQDPLLQDWQWVRGPMAALLRLTQEFGRRFAEVKRDQGTVDFHDLEQSALELLWGEKRERITSIAREWRQQFDLVFVDEYQDINAAQDAILRALGREGADANRFLVGDVKQSIYRFRLADPRIFQAYADQWRNGVEGALRPLAENWRSAEGVLNFVNALFEALMCREVGGVEYDEAARLRFGEKTNRVQLSVRPEDPPRVELHLRVRGLNEEETGEGVEDLIELSDAEHEAWLVARRLKKLKSSQFQVWDKKLNHFRPVEYADMAVLLRAPRNRAEAYAKVFEQARVPLVVARSGFFDAQEVRDLLSLLTVLDNPLQDLPLLAVLRSPLVGLTLDELALVRLARREAPFWTALQHFHREPELATEKRPASCQDATEQSVSSGRPLTSSLSPSGGEGAQRAGEGESQVTSAAAEELITSAHEILTRFLEQFHRWRELARRGSLSECLETVLDETSYEAWLATESRGAQRLGNVQRLLALTRQFDQFQRQGLFRFLRYVEAQEDAELDLESATPPAQDAVQLMSIHQSKGLEFPVVVVAGLGGRFNFEDLKGQVILDEQYGLCPMVKPPHTGQRYPSLPYWLARKRQRREALGEELRLLYVACTRARDQLLLVGTASLKAVQEWPKESADRLAPHQILSANSCLAWLGRWLPRATGHEDWTASGQSPLLKWTVHAEGLDRTQRESAATGLETGVDVNPSPVIASAISSSVYTELEAERLRLLESRLNWTYTNLPATEEKAKVSVTELRRRAEEPDEDAAPWFQVSGSRFRVPRSTPATEPALSATEVGNAHHLLLQWVDLAVAGSLDGLRAEARRLVTAGVLTVEQETALDLDAVAGFWNSELGRRIRENSPRVRRELPFTARLSPVDVEAVGLQSRPGLTPDDFLVIQGMIDLAVFSPEGIWVVDFKTDNVTKREVEGKLHTYAPQLRLYALALERIHGRPVRECWLHFLKRGKSLPV